MLVLVRPNYERLAKLAQDQDCVATRKQLRAIGFSDKRISSLVRRKLWVQLQRGVYLLGPGPPTWRQLARAAQWAGGSSVALDGGSSLLWWRLEGPGEGDVELALLNRQGGPRPRGVVIRQPSRPLVTINRDKVQVVCIEDALLGFAASCDDRRALEVAIESALLSNRTTERKIWQTIGRNSRRGVRGVALLRYVMEHRPAGRPARSVLELEVLELIRGSGLPLPARNVEVIDANGDRREIDLCYLDARGAIEADSRRFHSTASQKAEDKRRQRALEAIGFRFIRVTWRDVFDRPRWVLDEVRRLLEGVVAAEG